MKRQQWFRWTIEVEVHRIWVEDGFDFKEFGGCKGNAAAHERLRALLPYARGSEVRARVLKAPPRCTIRRAQGYKR